MIDELRLHRTTLRCKKPFKIATGTQDICHGILIELRTTDGQVGLGEGVPLPYLTSETLEGCQSALRDVLFPAIRGLDSFAIEEAHLRMNRALSGHPAARAAIDLALHDLNGKKLGQPVFRLLGGQGAPVETNNSIGICSPAEAATDARGLVESGFTIIKLKVGNDPKLDVDRVRAVRSAIGPDLHLRIDANEGWTYVQALFALTRMEALQVEFVEQPLARWDLKGMARLRQRTTIPLAADESVRTAQDALRVIEAEAADIVNIKLMKSGGLWPAREIVALCRAAGVDLMVGGMVGESTLAVTAAATLASTFRFRYADLDADLLLREQLQREGGSLLSGNLREIPREAGFGITHLNEDFLTFVPSC